MSDQPSRPEDLAALAEQLWGPREQRPGASPPPPPHGSSSTDGSDRLALVEGQIAELRQAAARRQAAWLDRARAEIRAELEAADTRREQAVGRLNQRIDAVDRRMTELATAVVAQVERDLLSALQAQIREGIARLEASIAAQHADRVQRTEAELASLRADVDAARGLGGQRQ